jgi:hypothetical protein
LGRGDDARGPRSAGRTPGVRALDARTGHSNNAATLPRRLEPSGGLIEKQRGLLFSGPHAPGRDCGKAPSEPG